MRTFTRLVAAFLIVPQLISAQELRLDHPGLALDRLRSLCVSREPDDYQILKRHLDSLNARFKDAAARRDPDLQSRFGCVNAMLYVRVPRTKVGNSEYRSPTAWLAQQGFLTALQLRPSDSIAAIGLATLSLEVGESIDHSRLAAERIARAVYASVQSGMTVPIVLRACAEFTLATADLATARYCTHRALEIGVDSTWHLERRAMMAFIDGDPDEGTTWFERAVMTAHDSAARDDLAWRVRWIVDSMWMNGNNIVDAWRGLTDSARVIWVRQHLAHAAPDGTDIPLYISLLDAAFTNPRFQGPMFQSCPIVIVRNGAQQAADTTGCIGSELYGGKHIAVTSQLVRLWNPATGNPLGVLGFAVDRHTVKADSGTFNSRLASVAVTIRQYEWETANWRDTTIAMHLPVSNDLSGAPIPGYVVVPVFEGAVTWSLAVQQGMNGGLGSNEGMLPIGSGPLLLSDLVLGVTEQGLAFPLGQDTITLAPQDLVRKKKPLELYFQLRSEKPAEELRAEIILHKITAGQIDAAPEITMTTRLTVAPGITPVHRELDISQIGGSDHQLEVRIVNAAGTLVAKRTVNLLVR